MDLTAEQVAAWINDNPGKLEVTWSDRTGRHAEFRPLDFKSFLYVTELGIVLICVEPHKEKA